MASHKVIITFLFSLLVSVGMVSLAGCGDANPAGAGSIYVNAAVGMDTNLGTQTAPFKTITKALSAASANGAGTIYVAPGTYDAFNGEVFPLRVPNNVTIIGDVANKGSTTFISGYGNYTLSGTATVVKPSLVILPGATATLSGLKIGGAWDVPVIIDGATNATLTSNNLDGISAFGGISDGIWIGANATATLTNNIITGTNWKWGGVFITNHSIVTLKGNTITDTGLPAVSVIGNNVSAASPLVNLGMNGSAGNNTIIGPATFVGLYLFNSPNVIYVSGNTWKPNVQGADALGHYPVGTVVSTATAMVAGNNYAASSSATVGSIQFYTAPASGSMVWSVPIPNRVK